MCFEKYLKSCEKCAKSSGSDITVTVKKWWLIKSHSAQPFIIKGHKKRTPLSTCKCRNAVFWNLHPVRSFTKAPLSVCMKQAMFTKNTHVHVAVAKEVTKEHIKNCRPMGRVHDSPLDESSMHSWSTFGRLATPGKARHSSKFSPFCG